MNNILVIKLRYIGDVLLATPVLTALRGAFPQARLTMAVNRGTEEILKGNPDLTEVLVVDRGGLGADLRFLQEIRRQRFDCVIDLTDGDRSAMMAWTSGAPVRIGFNAEHRWRGLLYTLIVTASSVHRVERDLAAVRALGIEPKTDLPVLNLSPQEEHQAAVLLEEIGAGRTNGVGGRRMVLLHPGARYWFKTWPAERFAELADRLTDTCRCQILVAGGDQDGDMVNRVRTHARCNLKILAGRADLRQFAAIVKRCAVFIGNDTGAMHIAAAMGTSVVALFGPSHPAEWGPRGRDTTVIYKGMDCRPCFHPTCRRGEDNCMKQISVEEVFAAAHRFLVKQAEVGV